MSQTESRQNPSTPHSLGFSLAWDLGGKTFDQRNQPYPLRSDEAREYYAGYRDGCHDISEHRRDLQAKEERRMASEASQ